MPARAGALLLAAVLLAGCTGVATSAAPSVSEGPALSLDDLEATPVDDREEGVAMAFDAEAAAELLQDVPADLDFTTSAVVCVFLGPRQTTGWELDLSTLSLSGDVLTIRARESVPRGTTRPVVTYPADCGLVPRAALPVRELTVRADDTVSGEFIADAVIDVPPPSSAP
jgi:hypothetical protein